MKKNWSLLNIVSLIMVGTWLLGCQQNTAEQNTKAKGLIGMAQILYKKSTTPKEEAFVEPALRQNAEKAFLKYKEIVEENPDSAYMAEALINMARIRSDFGPAKEAISYWLRITYDYADSEHYKEADENIKKVVKKWMAAAGNHVYRKRYLEAVALYKQVLKINTYNAEAHLALGEAYANSNRYDEAIREYKTAIDLDPRYMEAQYLLGLVYLAKNQFGDALKQFEAVTEIKPDMAAAYYNMALIYQEKLADPKKARELWQKYLEKTQDLEKEKKWQPSAQYYLNSL